MRNVKRIVYHSLQKTGTINPHDKEIQKVMSVCSSPYRQSHDILLYETADKIWEVVNESSR